MNDSQEQQESQKPAKPEPGFWTRLDILLKPIGGLATACVVAYIGYLGSNALQKNQQSEAKVQLYAQIMSSREQAETGLRREMFNSIIQTFLGSGKDKLDPQTELERQILAVELLTYNFHDALDLGPLFKYLEQKSSVILAGSPDKLESTLNALKRTARDVTSKQMASLESDGEIKDSQFYFSNALRGEPYINTILPARPKPPPEILRVKDGDADNGKIEKSWLPQKLFRVEVLDWDPVSEEIRVRLKVSNAETLDVEVDEVFWVGSFDFPQIDNTRLNGGGRCALVLQNFTYYPEPEMSELYSANGALLGTDEVFGDVRLNLIYFHGSRASLKSKPYYDEVISEAIGR